MDERDILNALSDMIATEQSVREQLLSGEVDESSARADLASLGTWLDQCWDLLRQRRSPAGSGQHPDTAGRPPDGDENYSG